VTLNRRGTSRGTTTGITARATTATTTAAAPTESYNIEDWPLFGRDRDNTRYAPQTQINAKTISRLGEAWSDDLGGNQYLQESFPIVVDGVVYVIDESHKLWAFGLPSSDDIFKNGFDP